MIAVDSSTLIAYVTGDIASDTDTLHAALLQGGKVALCPLVITEMTSVLLDESARELLGKLHRLEFTAGFWECAGALRYKLIREKLKARVADAVIAQSAIDHGIPLLTRDRDFRHYATLCGLELA
jgi:predicted nucleic acid-binding protein